MDSRLDPSVKIGVSNECFLDLGLQRIWWESDGATFVPLHFIVYLGLSSWCKLLESWV